MAPSSRGSRSPTGSQIVQPYRMHVSQRYLELTRKKLELTRLPRDAQASTQQFMDFGVTKADLEPLVDHWTDEYDWRTQETLLNDSLPQFRTNINGARLHFVHRQSRSSNAIPLLFVHGFPESFITVGAMINELCDPIDSPARPGEQPQAFHVIAPSIPGFGFSDVVPEEGNAMPTTAAIFDGLMKMLGYHQYIAHGSGWGFRICRMLALGCAGSCLAIHTVNPDVPAPRSSFGYAQQDMMSPVASSPGSGSQSPPLSPGLPPQLGDRPQTASYALCDSPSGLLAFVLDAIRPPTLGRETVRSAYAATDRSIDSSPAFRPQSLSPHSSVASTPISRSPFDSQALELSGLSTVWTPTAILNWAMIYWLPGPEVAMRWVTNSAALLPSLWLSYSNVPLGITHFRDPAALSTGTGQMPPQWCKAYHRVAMLIRREGRIRYAAWERPVEVVMDIRQLAGLVLGGYGASAGHSQYGPSPSPNTANGLPNGTVISPYKGPSISTFLARFGKLDLLAYMNKYWVSQGQPNGDFWGHEFSKHATCYSTFDLPCYGPERVEHEDVFDFFQTVILYYRRLPTWGWLGAHNIYPSNTTTYTLSDMEAALRAEYGSTPYLGCSGPRYNETAAGKNSTDRGRTQLSELWYYFHSYGRPQNGNWEHVNQTGTSSCAKAKGAIHYFERTKSSVGPN
ncbi:hypothetical protein LTR62_008508 [Meristemomyces frigidus]|uniref:ribonuclease T2 n=1 Tax=Meristemomyces frigidus TaxID=1508187 RepID=A0AAN7TH42_9PEZI|nr:hypothetical protein LTR62_008508 [Meristemomyces frigidus]